ncbi:hypothetical protein QCA50_019302 [Cerrena zonata]|uniref:Aminoglycoside phosphotransferase domain-containing protein n=1 Tax=Cerrena zonata TaxID=2478898 RepID=A0AAW0FFB6_9APHY
MCQISRSMISTTGTGYESLNKYVLRRITKLVEANPDGDMEGALQELYTKYSRKRPNVTDDHRVKRAHARIETRRTVPESVPSGPRNHDSTPLSFHPQRPFENGYVTIGSPVSPRVLELLQLEEEHSSSELSEAVLYLFATQKPLAVNITAAVVPLGDDIVIKTGYHVSLDELHMLQFLHTHEPTISAPRVHGHITIGPVSCLFMTRLPGNTLKSIWPTMTVSQKLAVQSSLNDMFITLRSVPWTDTCRADMSNTGFLGSLSPHPVCKDMRRTLRESKSPIRNEADFNEFIGTDEQSMKHTSPRYRSWVLSMLRSDHRIVLTHGDFHPNNVIVDVRVEDGHEKITVGIIDWETGGFYPEYWEYVKAMNLRTVKDDSDWWDFLPRSIVDYEQEIAIDRLLERSVLYGV